MRLAESDESLLAIGLGAIVGVDELADIEALGGLGHAAGGSIDDISHRAALFLHDGLDGWRDGHGVAMAATDSAHLVMVSSLTRGRTPSWTNTAWSRPTAASKAARPLRDGIPGP